MYNQRIELSCGNQSLVLNTALDTTTNIYTRVDTEYYINNGMRSIRGVIADKIELLTYALLDGGVAERGTGTELCLVIEQEEDWAPQVTWKVLATEGAAILKEETWIIDSITESIS